MLSRVLDILVCAFIFLNILAFEFPIMGVPLRFIVIALLLVLSFIIGPKYFLSGHFVKFIIPAYYFYFILTVYSLSQGNDMENIMLYIRPLLMLLTIPPFMYLFDKYGVKRYMNVFCISCIGLVFVFIYYYYKVIVDPSIIADLQEEEGLVQAVINDLGPRVVIKTFVMLVPFAIYVMEKIQGLKFHIFFVLIIILGALSQMFGLIIPVVIFYFYILYKRGERKTIYLTLLGIALFAVSQVMFVKDIMDTKESSADAKSSQIANIFKDMDSLDLLFGRGIGCIFKNFDGRSDATPLLEVSAVQIFQAGGFLFIWLILYVYLRPALKAIKSNNDYQLKLIGLSYLGFFLASLTNPYLLGGGALLLIVMIVAYPRNRAY